MDVYAFKEQAASCNGEGFVWSNKTQAKARLGFLRFSQVHFGPLLEQQNGTNFKNPSLCL